MAAVLVLADQISLEAVDVEVVSTLDRDTAITHIFDALFSPRRMVQGRKTSVTGVLAFEIASAADQYF